VTGDSWAAGLDYSTITNRCSYTNKLSETIRRPNIRAVMIYNYDVWALASLRKVENVFSQLQQPARYTTSSPPIDNALRENIVETLIVLYLYVFTVTPVCRCFDIYFDGSKFLSFERRNATAGRLILNLF